MIEVQHLHKRFAERVAVQDISFTASNGTITGLLGLNGAGKSTTLRMIGGVLRPERGYIRIDGVPYPDAQHHVGALLDHMGLSARLTVRENIFYFGSLRGIPPRRLHSGIDELISILGLESIAGRRASGLSQGQRMKTALARAIIHEPANLLLDEPANGLDVVTIRSLRAFLRKGRDRGQCILYSSHVLEEVQTLCDAIVIIARGSVIAEGTVSEICRKAGTVSLEEAFVRLTEMSETAPC